VEALSSDYRDMSTMHLTATDLFDEFRRDEEAALRPCLHCLLERCPDGERASLDTLLDDWLMSASSPPYSPVQLRRLSEKIMPIIERAEKDPSVIAARDQWDAEWRDVPWLAKRWRRLNGRVRIGWMLWRAKRRPKPWE
jgi:hypothetical protein